MKKTFIFVGLILILAVSGFSQAKKKNTKKPVKKTTATTVATVQPTSSEVIEVATTPTSTPIPTKKNERPETLPDNQEKEPKKKNQADRNASNTKTKPEKIKYPYLYEFSQPNFVVSHIVIEHDENGKGIITFEYKNSSDEPITDPIQISGAALEKINKLFETLNFISSTEVYQSPIRDYGHLGNHTVTLRKDSLERTAKYNWTENKDAKALVEEYRKVGEQYIWYFDMNISRENQPLEAPGMVNRLDSLIKRGEISDPPQMLPYLKDLSNDERIPLLARNHVLRVIKEIEKNAEKDKPKQK